MKIDTTNANAFASTFYFFADTQASAKKNKKSLQANAPDSADILKLKRQTIGQKEERTDNSGFKKLAVQLLQDVQVSNQTFVVADSFVLRSRQLLKPAKR